MSSRAIIIVLIVDRKILTPNLPDVAALLGEQKFRLSTSKSGVFELFLSFFVRLTAKRFKNRKKTKISEEKRRNEFCDLPSFNHFP